MIFTREMNHSGPEGKSKTKEKIAMENMEVLKVYNLVNSKGNELQLELG